jgi:hypothetical protein
LNAIPIHLAAEGTLDEAVLRRMLQRASSAYCFGVCHGKRGKGFLQQNAHRFNLAARNVPFAIIADLDREPCAPQLIQSWLPNGRNTGLLLRIAVREVEAWLMADRANLASFLGIRQDLVPAYPDTCADPKAALVEMAKRSRKRWVKEDIVPAVNSTARVGKNYLGRMVDYVNRHWRLNAATRARSPSLDTAMAAFENFSRLYGSSG